MGLLKGLLKLGVFVGAVAATGYVAERALLARLEENPDPDPNWRPTTPAGETLRIPTKDGTTLRAVAAGEGPPLVLIHGLMFSIDGWSTVFTDLVDAGHRVIAYDMRGHGGSGVGSDGWEMETFGDDLGSVLEHLDLRQAVVVGHSMGGMSALTFALDNPRRAAERLAGLVLCSTSGGGIYDSPQNKAQLMALRAGLAQKLINHPVHGPLLSRLNFGPRPRFSQVKGFNAMYAACDPETVQNAPIAMEFYDVRSRLGDVEVPTMVLHGSDDGALPPEGASLLAEGIPGARLEWISGAGHMVHWEAPTEFTDLVIDFAKERQVAVS